MVFKTSLRRMMTWHIVTPARTLHNSGMEDFVGPRSAPHKQPLTNNTCASLAGAGRTVLRHRAPRAARNSVSTIYAVHRP
jgi:hypothetical protein